MAKGASKSNAQPDVLVLGCHPSAFLAVALLKKTPNLTVLHCGVDAARDPDRLVMINPALFELHPILADLKKELELTETYGLRFLANEPTTSNQYSKTEVTSYIASFKQLQSAMQKLAGVSGANASLTIHGIDETGVDLTIGRTRCTPKLILLACSLPEEQRQPLGLSAGWDADVLRRYSVARMKPAKVLPSPDTASAANQRLIPMSLDLGGTLRWAWMLATPACVQLSVEQPANDAGAQQVAQALQKWADVLAGHGYLKPAAIEASAITTIDLPFAGALARELIANRTLLFGPAGGFYSACAEEIYPCCWSAMFAVSAARAALKERFLQDALQDYRLKWGGTLGDYLRGPQQNLKFLLPLIYRNSTMTARLAEAILFGESVVR